GGARVLWGIWDVSIDSATSEITVTPLRGAAFTANVTRFMQPPVSPVNMVSFAVQPGGVPADGYFIVDVSLKHPFPGLNQYNGFDVRGIFMANGSITGEYDPDVVRSGPDDAGLLNADGYTRWWNWQEFTNYNVIFGATQGKLAPPVHPTATVNPFKYFADGLGTEDSMTALYPESRGFFTTNDPGTNKRRYELQFLTSGGKPVLSFNYAVDASWELPDDSYAPNYPVEAFPISANCNEAFYVGVTDAGSSAYYAGPGDFGGDLLLDIEVFDWQGGAKGDVPSEVAGLYLEGDIFTSPVDVLASATVLPGSTVNSSVFEVSIGSLDLTKSGEIELFGTVENTDPNTFKPQLPAGDLFNHPDAPLAAYFTCTVTIGTESPGPNPTVTGIDPDEGIPDCTPEFVTVSGTDFANGATFRLEMTGQPDIEATDIEWIDSNTLTGYLDLLDTLPGVYDVVVENPGGVTGVLEDAFTILDVIYVDGDNAGDPSMDGTLDHPFDTIQKGIDAAFASANEPVIVDQSTLDYSTFNLRNNSHVIGCNWNDGVGWPTVSQTNSFTYGSSVQDATIEGLFFKITINSGTNGIVFNQGSGLTLRGCKFSGQATTVQGYFVRFSQSSNVEIDYCEFTNIYQRGSDTDWRNLTAIVFGGTNGVSIHHSEFHHIGYDIPDAGAFGNSLTIIRVGYDGVPPHNVDFHHLLIYDIFDKTNCIRPSPNPDPQNWLSVFSLSNVNSFDWVGEFKLYNITVDDVRNADPPESTIMNAGHCNAAYMAMVGGDVRVWKNNIASNIIPTDDNMWSGNSSYFGWWVDNYVQPPPSPQPMDYSDCFNIGKPLPNGANSWQWTSGYINQCQAGTGSYQNYQDIDPQYDMTPGDNFYHPTNTMISQGADDGSEMGAFGGPEGDWIPPSQL
ncbi:MAG: right-handed parallel beta-helix repeat-containing protein, partial [bacterium]